MAIVDHEVSGSGFVDRVAELVSCLHRFPELAVQIRAKSDPVALGEACSRVGPHPRVFVNGTAAEARALGARSIHLSEAAREVGGDLTSFVHVCAAIHDEQGAREAAVLGASLAIFAPVFSPRSKDREGRGAHALRLVCATRSIPVLALGGVEEGRIASCVSAGAWGIAALSPASDPAIDAAAWVERMVLALRACPPGRVG
jgi:thiamine monophosphate synthase